MFYWALQLNNSARTHSRTHKIGGRPLTRLELLAGVEPTCSIGIALIVRTGAASGPVGLLRNQSCRAPITATPREVVEAVLAHTVVDKVEAAYLRNDLFEKRRRLMQDWAEFCIPPGGNRESAQ